LFRQIDPATSAGRQRGSSDSHWLFAGQMPFALAGARKNSASPILKSYPQVIHNSPKSL